MSKSIKPIFLLADSQVLFWKNQENFFMERVRELVGEDSSEDSIQAAYIGASNLDEPQFYDIFVSAMELVDISDCRMIPSEPDAKDLEFLKNADIILLAGGNVEVGWNVIKEKFQEIIVIRYHQGAVLIGISAGAVQLGMRGWKNDDNTMDSLFETFQLVPAVMDVHNEDTDWERLDKIIHHLGGYNRGFGIPSGGAAAYHPDWSFEAIRQHLVEFSRVEEEFRRSLVLPGQSSSKE